MMQIPKTPILLAALALCQSTVFAQIPYPTINTNNIIVVTNAPYNAVGDGVTTNTMAIQNAINAAAAGGTTNGLKGGTVEIPAATGTYLSGPLTMSSYVNLQIDKGATLQMLPYGSYPGGSSPVDFISATGAKDIELSGSGTIDGQGAAWWAAYDSSSIARPYAMFGPNGCNTVLVCNVTLQNPPNTHMTIGANGSVPCGNVMVTNLTINTADGTPNTDGIDLDGTNVEIVNSHISDGDDHIAIGGSNGRMANILVTNCFFGTGHGVSIGSITSAGVSNLLVINCTWSGSENGIRVKSERGRGGLVQALTYENLGMTNVQSPILFYSYYNYGEGQLNEATPYMAATDTIQTVTSSTPIWRNIVVSNLTATESGSSAPIMIWGLPEMLFSNVVLNDVNISGSSAGTCQFYYVTNFQVINSQITVKSGTPNYTFYGVQMNVSNSQPSTTTQTLSGLATNGIDNYLSFYNATVATQFTNVIAGAPLILGGSTFTVNNNLAMPVSSAFNFQLGTSAATVAVKGNLTLGGTVNVSAGNGFASGTYTLLTYTGSLSGSSPTLSSVPSGLNYAFDTSVSGKVNLDVSKTTPLLETTPSASAITYGQVLSSSILSGGAFTNSAGTAVPGTFAFTTPSATPGAGTASQSVTFTPTNTVAYNTVTFSVNVTVNRATPILENLPTSSAIIYGQALSASTLNGGTFTNASGTTVPGTFAFTTPSATQGAGTANQLVTFTPNDTTDYTTPAAFNVSVTISPLVVILTGTRAYDGTTNALFGILSVANVVGNDNVMVASGRVGLAAATVGTNSVTSTTGLTLGGTAAGNYTLAGVNGAVIITQAVSSVALVSSSNPTPYNVGVMFTATVSGADMPTGTVQFSTNGVNFDMETLTNGVATNMGTVLLPLGSNSISAAYSGDENYLASTNNLVELVKAPQINAINAGTEGLMMSGSEGAPDETYYMLESTNLSLPLSQWTPVLTNRFDNNGNFNLTNAVTPNLPGIFYILQLQQ